jgi:hypothetical protein
MIHFDPIVELIPIHGKSVPLNVPIASLRGRGLGKP